MNSLSVNVISLKNTALKLLKENFSLDEIASKLLSIRQIKKDEISSFLNQ